MIINIDDTKNLKRIVIEFDIDSDLQDSQNTQNSKDLKDPKDLKNNILEIHNKSKSLNTNVKKQDTIINKNNEIPIDFESYSTESTEVSKEVVEKPQIPERRRESKIADSMQNLSI